MGQLIFPWFRATFLVHSGCSSSMNNYWVANQIHFFNCMFVPDEGWNSGYIHDELSTGEPEQAALCLFHGTHPADSFLHQGMSPSAITETHNFSTATSCDF